ncbi:MAG: glycosyltransferase, partial [bacterium]
LAGGGAERVASNLSIHLDEEKYNKYVVVYYDEEVEYNYNGELLNLNTGKTNNFFVKLFNFFKKIYKLKKIKQKYNIDVTISLLPNPNLVNILSRHNDKVIVSVRNFISKSLTGIYGNIYKVLIKIIYNKADLIVPVSKAIKKDLIKNYNLNRDKIKVIYNPYDIDEIEKKAIMQTEDEYKEVFKNPVIITMGRLTEQKGHWYLIRALKKIKESIKDIQLVILGEGPLRSKLETLVCNLNLEQSVHFLGFQNNPFKYINKSSVFVLPSLFEGFPNALSEAMACSVPVISTDCDSGPREILMDNTDYKQNKKEYGEYGILVPVFDGQKYDYQELLTLEEEI